MSWNDTIQTRAEQRELKRMAILRTAAQTFNRKGFRETSLDDLAELLSISKPTLYYYVKNKDDILSGILEMAMAAIREVIGIELESNGSGLERLNRFMQRYSAVQTDDFGAALIMTRSNAFEERFKAQYATAAREVSDAVIHLIQVGIEDGSIGVCDPKFMAVAMLGNINETVYWYVMEGRDSPAETVARFMQIFEQGLLPRD